MNGQTDGQTDQNTGNQSKKPFNVNLGFNVEVFFTFQMNDFGSLKKKSFLFSSVLVGKNHLICILSSTFKKRSGRFGFLCFRNFEKKIKMSIEIGFICPRHFRLSFLV